MRKSIYIAVYFLIFGILASCSRNPVTGKKEISFMSHAQELALGKQSDPGIISNFGLYENAQLQAFVNEKGNQMAKISHRPDLDFKFRILDSPVINAFAVPGGYVYFTRGILAHFNNEAEFAGVLGHEIGHVTARHSAKQYTKQMIAQIGLVAGVIFSEDFRRYANQASQGMQLLFLKFGRDNESQSDRLGVEYSTKIGYDSKHMANFFGTLHKLSSGSGNERIPSFMSTHPDPLDRFKKVGEHTVEWQAKDSTRATYKVNRNSYLKMVDGLVYGEDPRQGYVENNVFYHPEMKFQYPIPRNWKTVNSPAQVQMAPQDGKAMMMLQLAAEKTPDEAARAFVSNNKLRLVDSKKLRLNGMDVVAFVSDQVDENQTQALQQRQAYEAYQAQQQSMSSNTKQPAPTTGQKPTSTSTTTKGTKIPSKSPSSSTSTSKTTKGTKIPSKSTNTSGNTSGTSKGTKIPSNTNNTPNQTPSKTLPSRTTPSSPSNNAGSGSGGPAPRDYVASLRIMSYAILYNGNVYLIHGMSKYEDFARYVATFRNTQENFKVLSDPSKINVKPDKIHVKTVSSNGTLQTAFNSFKVPSSKHKTLAILNGMELNTPVKKGDLIKIIGK